MDYPQHEVGEKPFGPEIEPVAHYEAYEPPKKKRGCLFYGCITLIVLGVLALIVIAAASYTAYYFLQNTIKEYTSTTPVPVPTVSFTDEQRKERDDRWAAFKEAVKKHETAEIQFTEDDINALISEKPEVRDKVYITLKGDQVSGQVSLPLDDLGVPLVPKGRYFNGQMSLTAKIDEGVLDVRLRALEVNGKTMPPNVAAQFANQNLAKDVKFEGETNAVMRRIDSLVIKDGKVIIRANVREEPKEGVERKAEAPTDTKKEEPTPIEAKPAEEPTEKTAPADTPKAAA
jgi:hypothetical protein